MARIDLFIFGYRRYKTDKSVIAEVLYLAGKSLDFQLEIFAEKFKSHCQ